ncbi:MAG: hypothetical protein KUA43_03425 [Hoeflea sp.]|uniref:hypothetical protein n=1 Tax=Hoeflea sp. TaxID=1940281 RepID=UPI001D41FD2D|nr:hypothetical protein [Hoeflea sp.]MBU4529981.1 hypothetical protein [Alphaproteobacteria bacterium]MBU4543208.1 hypothetical protein [Alphaproteobacteria bacterium]MBU4550252.1 hypothetical protein [Alphaproteobacteria bacterium]MBV1722474.1 hypothetical protein [Hoeflea sp.]MBV1761624.1 hypothetical protein [Hoeflea sp.]
MPDYKDMLRRFERGELDPAGFRHADHVGVAYEALLRDGFFKALLIYAEGLTALVEEAGLPDKFNATVTFAYMSAIAERMHRHPAASAQDFISANPDLLSGAVLDRHSKARLNSELARQVALPPDL